MRKEIIDLLIDVLSTNSPQDRKTYILECLAIYDFGPRDDVPRLIEFLDSKIKEKADKSVRKIPQRKSTNSKKWEIANFFTDNKFANNCATCGCQTHNIVFKHRVDGRYIYWHADPKCFPENRFQEFATNKKYQEWSKNRNENY